MVTDNFYFQCVGLPFGFYRTTCGRRNLKKGRKSLRLVATDGSTLRQIAQAQKNIAAVNNNLISLQHPSFSSAADL
jgi:hypothetical protein